METLIIGILLVITFVIISLKAHDYYFKKFPLAYFDIGNVNRVARYLEIKTRDDLYKNGYLTKHQWDCVLELQMQEIDKILHEKSSRIVR